VLLVLLLASALAIVRARNLFAVVVLSGIYSFIMATQLTVLDAVDVAMTEASVGAGISTVLLLGTLYLTGSEEAAPGHRPILPLLVALATAGILIYGTLGIPVFGDPSGAIHQHVAPRYLQEAVEATGIPNVVTAVLASYRGYDTLGETTVIFTAGIGVILLLGMGRRARRGTQGQAGGMHEYLVLRVIAKLLIPFALLFALYVQFHGDFGPGGGFQAGVILAAGVIFYTIIFGLANAQRLVPPRLVEILVALGVAVYAVVGDIGLLLGGNYLDYFVLDMDPVHGQHRGVFWVELGVCITVAGVMLAIFYAFAGRRRRPDAKS
jgi:multicomponent Na+:H+ antiporter subunit B